MSLAYKGSSAFTEQLGHPLVHILLKCKRLTSYAKQETSGYRMNQCTRSAIRMLPKPCWWYLLPIARVQVTAATLNRKTPCKPHSQILKALKLRGLWKGHFQKIRLHEILRPGISQDFACGSCSQASLWAGLKRNKVPWVLPRSQDKI